MHCQIQQLMLGALFSLVLAGCVGIRYESYQQGFRLSQYIESKILAPKNVQKIEQIYSLNFFSANPPYGHAENDVFFDILRLDVSLTGDFGRESVWHGSLVVRKRSGDKNWNNCEVFYATDEVLSADLSRMTSSEMSKHITPYAAGQTANGSESRQR